MQENHAVPGPHSASHDFSEARYRRPDQPGHGPCHTSGWAPRPAHVPHAQARVPGPQPPLGHAPSGTRGLSNYEPRLGEKDTGSRPVTRVPSHPATTRGRAVDTSAGPHGLCCFPGDGWPLGVGGFSCFKLVHCGSGNPSSVTLISDLFWGRNRVSDRLGAERTCSAGVGTFPKASCHLRTGRRLWAEGSHRGDSQRPRELPPSTPAASHTAGGTGVPGLHRPPGVSPGPRVQEGVLSVRSRVTPSLEKQSPRRTQPAPLRKVPNLEGAKVTPVNPEGDGSYMDRAVLSGDTANWS